MKWYRQFYESKSSGGMGGFVSCGKSCKVVFELNSNEYSIPSKLNFPIDHPSPSEFNDVCHVYN